MTNKLLTANRTLVSRQVSGNVYALEGITDATVQAVPVKQISFETKDILRALCNGVYTGEELAKHYVLPPLGLQEVERRNFWGFGINQKFLEIFAPTPTNTLEKLFQKDPRREVSAYSLRQIISRIAVAVQFLHDNHVVHNNINDRNIVTYGGAYNFFLANYIYASPLNPENAAKERKELTYIFQTIFEDYRTFCSRTFYPQKDHVTVLELSDRYINQDELMHAPNYAEIILNIVRPELHKKH